MRDSHAKKIALCGLMAALSMVIMCLGGLIPIATYICPVLCTLIGNVIFKLCGGRLAWTWYGTVCLLSFFFSPDKEAAIVFSFLGFYPYIKPFFDGVKVSIVLKLLYFNLVAILGYVLLLWVMGMEYVLTEFTEFGLIGIVIMLLLVNATFFMLDKLLDYKINRK